MAFSRPLNEDRLVLPRICLSLQAIDGVLPLALCPQAESQVPQHFRPSQTQVTRDGCFAYRSVSNT